jgi:hypothetical protein
MIEVADVDRRIAGSAGAIECDLEEARIRLLDAFVMRVEESDIPLVPDQ